VTRPSAATIAKLEQARRAEQAALGTLEQAQQAQNAVEALEQSYGQALARRAELIQALAKTMTAREIAEDLGISHQRVHVLAKGAAKKK